MHTSSLVSRRSRSTSRRGAFATIYAVSAFAFLACAALAVDVMLLRLARSETRAVADIACHTALLRLRATGDRGHAAAMAAAVVRENSVLGRPANLESVEFGMWVDGAFTADSVHGNAVRVTVGSRTKMTFAALWQPDLELRQTSTAAARILHAIVVLDITNSWSPIDFEDARAGAVEVFDQLVATSGPSDRIGMVTFTGQFGVEQTPLQLALEAEDAGIRQEWADLRTASKAGVGNGRNCTKHSGDRKDDFSDPEGGCYPQMWREYRDEYGTDHAVGIDLAREMFAARSDPAVYRAMIVLTDGAPNGTGPAQTRVADGYEEARWDFRVVGEQRNHDQVVSASLVSAERAWTDDEVHTWVVSYQQTGSWLYDLAKGDGTFVHASNANDLVPIFADIAESLPTMLVE